MIWRVANGPSEEVASLGEGVAADMVIDPDTRDIYLSVGRSIWRMEQDGGNLIELVDVGLYPIIALRGDTLWISGSNGMNGSGVYRWREGAALEEVLPYQNDRYIHDLVSADAGLYFTSHVWNSGPSPRLSCVVNLLNPATDQVTAVAGAESEEGGYQDGTGQSAKFPPALALPKLRTEICMCRISITMYYAK